MKSVHDESDHLRIKRLTETFEAAIKQEPIAKDEVLKPTNAKSLDCTECGVLFITFQEQKNHKEQHHANDKEEGEVGQEVVIVDQGLVPYKMGSWGGEEKEYSFGGKRKEFA